MNTSTVRLRSGTYGDQAMVRGPGRHVRCASILCATACLTFTSGLGLAADRIDQGDYVSGYVAASASLPATAAAGRTPGSFGVTSTGAATYSIPIWTPPGVGNVDLKLSLEYNSRGGNGVIGQGWSLAGLSEISRCNRTVAQDGAPGPVTHTVVDRFCLDRQQLKLVSGTYGAVGAVYATEIESFSRISAVASAYGMAFVVTSKNGLVYEYGTSADSVIVDASTAVARTWALSRIRDRLSPTPNQISLRYGNDAVGSQNNIGTYRIASITYPTTASGLGPFYQVDFGYSARPANDPVVGYLAGSIVREPNKLDTITIRPYGSGSVTKSYNLAYTQGPTTNRLLLSSITECSASSCMRPTTISYKTGSGSWAAMLSTGLNASRAAAPIPVDLNGDGRDDLVYPKTSGSANSRWWVMFASATGFGAAIDTGLTTANDKKVLVAPFSGQGRAQLLIVQAGYWYVVTWTGTVFSSVNTGVPASGEFTAVDWDGDGLPDLVSVEPIPDPMAATGWAVRVRRNQTAPPGAVAFSTSTFTLWTSPLAYVGANAGTANATADFNGDGRADVLIGYMPGPYPPIHYYALLSNGFGSAPAVTPLPDDLMPGLMADFNADGCTDFYSNPVLMSNCAGGFNAVNPGAFPVGYGTSYAVADENGDGRADILYTNWTDKKWYVIRSTGDGFAAAVNLGISAIDGTVWFVLDQNGDGLTDLAFRDDTNGGRLKYHLHNAAAAPADVAVSFTDGFGITQGAAYASIAQSNYSKSTGAVFPEIDIQVPLYVVSQANVNGNTSGAFQQQFFYSGARAHLQGRGFEGFAARRTYDSRTSLYEIDYLKQTFPYTGMRLQHTLLQNNLTTRVSDSSATLAMQALGNAGVQQRFFPYAQSVTDSQYELGGTLNGILVSQAVTSFTFGDGFGNPTLISRTVTDKDPGSPYLATSWTTTTSATYYNNASTNCLGLPQAIAESRTAPGKVAMTRTTAYGADTVTCRISQQTLEPNAPEQKVTTTLEFDVCGNTNALRVVGARWDGVALPERATRIDYGSRCQLPEAVTNPLGEVRRIGFRYEFGVPSSVVDGNGLVTSWQYDDFGRRISEARPDGTSTTWTFDSCATQNCMSVSAPYQRFHEREVSVGTQSNALRSARSLLRRP